MYDALFVGHSNVVAIARNIDSEKYSGLSMLTLNLRVEEDKVRFEKAQDGDMKDALKARACFSMVGGNAHHLFGLIENPVPFDICLDSPPQDGRVMLHYAFVQEIFESWFQALFDILERIARTWDNVSHICSPPPIGDEFHLRKYPGVFCDRLHLGITPKAIRRKVYDIQCDIFRRKCAAIGVKFMEVPVQAVDHEGFLRPEYYNLDATHGNRAYGQLVLNQIVGALA